MLVVPLRMLTLDSVPARSPLIGILSYGLAWNVGSLPIDAGSEDFTGGERSGRN